MSALVINHTQHLATLDQTATETTRVFMANSIAESTKRVYQDDFKAFTNWCNQQSVSALPAESVTVANFIADQANQGFKPSTLNRRLAAIKFFHEAQGLPSPTTHKGVSATLKGIRRTLGTAPEKKAAATIDTLYQLLARIDTKTTTGKRDKALILLGFAGAFRRSELAALQVNDIEFVSEGLRVTIRQSKTDQEGQGQQIAIPQGKLKVVTALQDYLQATGIQSGAVFRSFKKGGAIMSESAISDRTVADLVKKYVLLAGLNPEQFAGHSLRSGFITSAAEAGANLFKIMDVSRHKSVQTVKGYVHSAEAFKDHAGSSFL